MTEGQYTANLNGGDETPSQSTQRRLIKADLNILYSLDPKDDEDSSESDESSVEEENDYYFLQIPEGTQSTPVTPLKRSDPGFSNAEKVKAQPRRHSITNPTNRAEHSSTMITFPFEYTNTLNVYNSKLSKASPLLQRRAAKLPHSMSKSTLQEEFFNSNGWQTTMQCLSLNLDEVVHIRNVLTKAELESLPVDLSLKDDVEKGRVCFLCMKTRFSLFSWGSSCKLCKQTVCAKCCSKMRIPVESFAKIPVSSLSPLSSPSEDGEFLPGIPGVIKSFGISSLSPTPPAPRLDSLGAQTQSSSTGHSSPNLSRKSGPDSDRSSSPATLKDLEDEDDGGDHFPSNGLTSTRAHANQSSSNNGPLSLPSISSLSMGIMSFKRKKFGRGLEALVCHDCRAMIAEIKKSASGGGLPQGMSKVLQNLNRFNSPAHAVQNNNLELGF